MCLIIHKPAGKTVSASIVESALARNSDGFGIMADGNAIKFKGLSLPAIRDVIDRYEDTDTAIHFRMATDGKVSRELAHPFPLVNGGHLMHNGVLSKYRTSRDAEESDTTRFIQEFLNPMLVDTGQFNVPLVEAEIYGNKLAVMDKHGNITRYGGDWFEHSGLYFSNTYAWDAPYDDYWDRYYDCATLDDNGDYWLTVNREKSGIADDMLWELLAIEDLLPLNDLNCVYYEDMDLWEMLLDAEICIADFLECCTDSTLLAIYTQCVREGLIKAA